MIRKYRKKPVVIEAVRWTGENCEEIRAFVGKRLRESFDDGGFLIETLEGAMKASMGDFIIKGINGEFYPCKPEIFEKTYEEVAQ